MTIHLPYDKAGLLDVLYRDARVESVDYAATIDVVATCNPRALGLVKTYVEGLDRAEGALGGVGIFLCGGSAPVPRPAFPSPEK